MSLWIAAHEFRREAAAKKPLQRSIHWMLDAWEQADDQRMRGWLMGVADLAVQATRALEAKPDTEGWSFELVIAPAVLEALAWRLDGPEIRGCTDKFMANVLNDGKRPEWPPPAHRHPLSCHARESGALSSDRVRE